MLEIKADNEPVISLPVYFKSDKKWKFDVRKKERKKRGPMARVEPETTDA